MVVTHHRAQRGWLRGILETLTARWRGTVVSAVAGRDTWQRKRRQRRLEAEAASHEGLYYYDSMIRDHGIVPRLEHLASIVNLLARKGETRRAYEFIRSFPMEPSKVVWRCLLSGCKIHKDLVLGRLAAEKILSIDPEDTSAHIMLSNIYAEAKMWDKIAQLRKIMKEKAMKKDTGCSWTESKNKMYSFSASHSTQFDGFDLPEVLNQLTVHLFHAEYLPDTSFNFHSEKELSLSNGEKLTDIAFHSIRRILFMVYTDLERLTPGESWLKHLKAEIFHQLWLQTAYKYSCAYNVRNQNVPNQMQSLLAECCK
ncbi:hypothetical protein F3Y22_tig00110328pilonHSYRG00333 [Hibiscus syriacus]|uniref:Pentatricopeptide repeat-containing protein n=1 Tax=Hibiscus syriacus TaxID=106335 RepID=A0A6A3B0P5_HIBSY|nr:hypothetical protein F3Y22_tig00110328pilonHSYRG00333 [Hibiscus syriacus]